uniref:Uncharacterized protein n=1 Tax=Myoviridae sp. ctIty1 TaxID=2827673 RepID=A0A8S5TG95_9CAUD|nr:MAG TPA: hypothetical protein [Myoviridae sp. ctIty1]
MDKGFVSLIHLLVCSHLYNTKFLKGGKVNV